MRSLNKRGRELRHGVQDLEGLIQGGMSSPLAEEFVQPMKTGCEVLSQAIHHRWSLDQAPDADTRGMLLIYRNVFGEEALGRAVRLSGLSDQEALQGLSDGTWDPFSEDLVGAGFEGDRSVVEEIRRIGEHGMTAEKSLDERDEELIEEITTLAYRMDREETPPEHTVELIRAVVPLLAADAEPDRQETMSVLARLGYFSRMAEGITVGGSAWQSEEITAAIQTCLENPGDAETTGDAMVECAPGLRGANLSRVPPRTCGTKVPCSLRSRACRTSSG